VDRLSLFSARCRFASGTARRSRAWWCKTNRCAFCQAYGLDTEIHDGATFVDDYGLRVSGNAILAQQPTPTPIPHGPADRTVWRIAAHAAATGPKRPRRLPLQTSAALKDRLQTCRVTTRKVSCSRRWAAGVAILTDNDGRMDLLHQWRLVERSDAQW